MSGMASSSGGSRGPVEQSQAESPDETALAQVRLLVHVAAAGAEAEATDALLRADQAVEALHTLGGDGAPVSPQALKGSESRRTMRAIQIGGTDDPR